MFQGIESKARFIEQAMAGEITARTIEDTSDVVLSAAEIKAIASGNPQIVRKVQLEAEVARLERVRSVWLDTRRNLQLERHFTEEEIRRLAGRRTLWEQAATIVAAHPYEPFHVDIATTQGSSVFKPFTERAEAGAAVRRLVHDTQSAAAFQRQRITGVIARYRGLNLVVQAHAVFAADLSLALPDGTTLDSVNASTDTGIWQSIGRTVSDIPATLRRLSERIAQARERIAAIDRELDRLETWDSQPGYDAALGELGAINAAFAAAEEQAGDEQGQEARTAEGVAAKAREVAANDGTLAEVLLALAKTECASAGWDEWQATFPPAPASLAWMTAEVERLAAPCPPYPAPDAAEDLDGEGAPALAGEIELSRSSTKARVLFGDARTERRMPRTEANRLVNSDAEVQQLPLF